MNQDNAQDRYIAVYGRGIAHFSSPLFDTREEVLAELGELLVNGVATWGKVVAVSVETPLPQPKETCVFVLTDKDSQLVAVLVGPASAAIHPLWVTFWNEQHQYLDRYADAAKFANVEAFAFWLKEHHGFTEPTANDAVVF